MDTEWANSYNEADNSSPEFQLQDWGFLQRHYSKTELREEEASSSRVCDRPLVNISINLSEASEERPFKKQRQENTKTIKFWNIYFEMIFTARLFYVSAFTCFGFYQFTTDKLFALGTITLLI